MKTLDTAVTIASDVRKWAEAEAVKTDSYAADSLCGWCAIAAGELWNRLHKRGIEADICVSINRRLGSHCFLLVDDHVLDVTATQFKEFKNRKVVIMHSKEAEVFEMYRVLETFGTSKQLRLYQNKRRWPSDQVAYA